LIEIRGKIAKKLKFLGKLKVILKIFTAKDHFAKGTKLRHPNG
jgi:hypothetical protein